MKIVCIIKLHNLAVKLSVWVVKYFSWVYWCFTSHAMIFQSYMWRHRCTGGLKWELYLRSGSYRHRHFVGFFNVPVLHRHETNLFMRWFWHRKRLSQKLGTLKLIRQSVCQSVSQPVCHKNFNLANIFWSINDRALIFGMHDPSDKPFLLIPCGDLDLDLWPTSRSNMLPGGESHFFKFACFSRFTRFCAVRTFMRHFYRAVCTPSY